MTSCANCGRLGAETTSPCGRCGWSIGQRSAQRSTKGPVAGAFAIALTTANAAGALSYLIGAITGVIALLIGPYKKDPWVRFHAFQSIFLTVIWIALMTVGETVLSVFEAMTELHLAGHTHLFSFHFGVYGLLDLSNASGLCGRAIKFAGLRPR